MKKFLVFLVIVEWDYRNTIIYLETERIYCIIHNYYIFQVPVFYYTEILNVHSVLCLVTMVPI